MSSEQQEPPQATADNRIAPEEVGQEEEDDSIMNPIRILCLHGAGTNQKVMQHQTRALQNRLGKKAEFHFIQGKHRWPDSKVDPLIVNLFGEGPYFGWMDAQIDQEKNERTDIQWRDALRDENVWITYKYLDEALNTVKEKIESDGPYDVLLGFSQGSIIITLATAYYLGETGSVPWKFNVQFAGFPVRDNGFKEKYMQKRLCHPSLMVLGREDPFYDWALSAQYQFEAPLYIEHTENHRIPKDVPTIHRICDEILLHCPRQKL